jgi:hypothetical protein
MHSSMAVLIHKFLTRADSSHTCIRRLWKQYPIRIAHSVWRRIKWGQPEGFFGNPWKLITSLLWKSHHVDHLKRTSTSRTNILKKSGESFVWLCYSICVIMRWTMNCSARLMGYHSTRLKYWKSFMGGSLSWSLWMIQIQMSQKKIAMTLR